MAEPSSKIIEIFNEYIWNLNQNGKFNEVNALWLLIYFDIWDIPFPNERWQEIVDYIQEVRSWHTDSFLDLLIIYAFEKVNQHHLSQLLFNLNESFQNQHTEDDNSNDNYLTKRNWRELALGIKAAVHGQFTTAITKFEMILPSLSNTTCGSTEQRDLFHQLYISLLLKTKQYHKAVSVLEKRLNERCVPLRLKQLANVYKLMGESSQWSRLMQQFEELKTKYNKDNSNKRK
jgi:hypothetical protein